MLNTSMWWVWGIPEFRSRNQLSQIQQQDGGFSCQNGRPVSLLQRTQWMRSRFLNQDVEFVIKVQYRLCRDKAYCSSIFQHFFVVIDILKCHQQYIRDMHIGYIRIFLRQDTEFCLVYLIFLSWQKSLQWCKFQNNIIEHYSSFIETIYISKLFVLTTWNCAHVKPTN